MVADELRANREFVLAELAAEDLRADRDFAAEALLEEDLRADRDSVLAEDLATKLADLKKQIDEDVRALRGPQGGAAAKRLLLLVPEYASVERQIEQAAAERRTYRDVVLAAACNNETLTVPSVEGSFLHPV